MHLRFLLFLQRFSNGTFLSLEISMVMICLILKLVLSSQPLSLWFGAQFLLAASLFVHSLTLLLLVCRADG